MAVIRGASRGRLARTPLVFCLLVLASAQPADGGTLSSGRPVTHRNGLIAFVTNERLEMAGLVSVDPRGRGLERLSAAPPEGQPVVSPDGDRLALVVGDELEVMRIDGTHRVLISGGRSPSWAPDGSRLAFVRPQTNGIAVVAADGGSTRDLGVSGSEPVWSPAGDWIAFFSGYSTLELIHPDGSGRTVIATNAYSDASILPVAWSHDGAWLSFGAVPADTNVLETNVIRPDGSGFHSFGNTFAPVWSPRADELAFGSSDSGFEIAAPDGSVRFSSDSISGTPVWSPNGAAVAVGSPDVPGEWIVRPSGGAISHVSIGGTPVWSPDSTRLAAVRSTSLRMIATSGGRPRVLAEGADPPILWFRDGRIAYVTLARLRTVIETTRRGSKAQVLVSSPTRFENGPLVDITGLAWAPDGKTLAYLYGSDLRVRRADGSGSRLLARNVTDAPAWSPDARWIAFGSVGGLRVVAAAGGPSRLLARVGGGAPAWSPDGRRIAFLIGAGPYALDVVDRDGKHLHQVADGVSSVPSWSPGGIRIAFSTGEDYGPNAIETVRYDGTGLATLASGDAEDTGHLFYGPRWSPDGRAILYFDDEYLCGSKCDELHVMLMRPDGSNKRTLPPIFESADWSPDSTKLLGQNGEGSLATYNLRTRRANYLGYVTGSWSWQPLPATRR